MNLRRATPADLVTLASRHRACFDEPWDAKAFAGLLDTPGTVALLSLDGFIVVRVAGDESEVLTIGVLPAARGTGQGRVLLLMGANEAHGLGATEIFLEVAAGNAPARRLYERAGFHKSGLRKGYYRKSGGPPEDALILRAELPLGVLGETADLD